MSGRRFERIVLSLPQGVGHRPAVEAAADLAEFLNIELLGTFIADRRLRELTGLPGRELRTLDLQWQPIDPTRISRDLEGLADIARSRFAEIVRSRAIKTSFDVISGARVMGSLIRAGDIVAIIEPAHPGERITQQFTGLLDAAFKTAAAILVVPRRILRASGPVMAVARSRDDVSIRVALEIAAALKERLVIATASGALPAAGIIADAEQLGVQVEQILASGARINTAPALSPSRSSERLRVVSSGRRPDDVHGLFSTLRGVPLLLVEPDRAELLAAKEKRSSRNANKVNSK